jgi:hypothetical protein
MPLGWNASLEFARPQDTRSRPNVTGSTDCENVSSIFGLVPLCDSDTFQFIGGLCVSTLCGFNPSALEKVFCIVVVLVGAVGIEPTTFGL